MLFALGMTANAQLGKPTTTVKDTFYIKHAYYNGKQLNRADWPDTMIVEDALKVFVAKSIYTKGDLKFTFSGRKYEASCNGKNEEIFFGDEDEYVEIGDYRFYINKKKPEKDKRSGLLYTLSGRTIVSMPTPKYHSNYQGTVNIKVWVDRDGKVIRAEYSPKGSNTSNTEMIEAAKEAAFKAHFNPDANAPEEQVGRITYIFKVQ